MAAAFKAGPAGMFWKGPDNPYFLLCGSYTNYTVMLLNSAPSVKVTKTTGKGVSTAGFGLQARVYLPLLQAICTWESHLLHLT